MNATAPATIALKTGRDETSEIAVGDFLSELLVTDTLVWEVVKITEKTVTVRSTRQGQHVKNNHIDGNPFPVTYMEALPNPDGQTKTLRVRKDGSIRVGSHVGARPLYPTPKVGGVAVTRTDYRY